MLCPANMSYPFFLALMITDHIYHLFIVLCCMPTFIGVIMHVCFYIAPYSFVQIQRLLVAMKIKLLLLSLLLLLLLLLLLIGLRQEISVRNHMCQCSACFMEERCMFIGFVVAYGGFIWFY